MKSEKFNDELLKRYLLDDISDEEMQEIEKQFLEDDSLFEQMNAIEDELFYDYRQNRLNARENAVFKRKFLQTKEGREKAEFASVFLKATENLVETKNMEENSVPWWQTLTSFFNSPMQFGLAAVSLLVVCSLGLVIYLNLNAGNEIVDLPENSTKNSNEQILAEERKQSSGNENQQTEIAKEKEKPEPIEKDLPESIKTPISKKEIAENQPKPKPNKRDKSPQKPPIPKKTQPQRSFVALILSPGNFSRSGGDGMKRVNLTSSIKNLKISLSVNNVEDYKVFRASLKTINEGREVWSSSPIKIQGKGNKKSASINIPANILERTDYEISLIGTTENGENEEIDTYYFSVLK